MLPGALVEQFWDRVSSIVRKKCDLSEQMTQSVVFRFREETEPKVGEMIYHDNVENIAQTVINAVKNGEYVDAGRRGP